MKYGTKIFLLFLTSNECYDFHLRTLRINCNLCGKKVTGRNAKVFILLSL